MWLFEGGGGGREGVVVVEEEEEEEEEPSSLLLPPLYYDQGSKMIDESAESTMAYKTHTHTRGSTGKHCTVY